MAAASACCSGVSRSYSAPLPPPARSRQVPRQSEQQGGGGGATDDRGRDRIGSARRHQNNELAGRQRDGGARTCRRRVSRRRGAATPCSAQRAEAGPGAVLVPLVADSRLRGRQSVNPAAIPPRRRGSLQSAGRGEVKWQAVRVCPHQERLRRPVILGRVPQHPGLPPPPHTEPGPCSGRSSIYGFR